MSERLAVVGAGTFGFALAHALAEAFEDTQLLARNEVAAVTLQRSRQHPQHSVTLSPRVTVTAAPAQALAHAGVVVFALPTAAYPEWLKAYAHLLPNEAATLIASKGARLSEAGELQTPRLWLGETRGSLARCYLLSGPSFAAPLARGEFTALVLGHHGEREAAALLAQRLSTPSRRIYLSDDPRGLELGGALKNVMAIAAGFMAGAGFGPNAEAAFIARAMAELCRLGTALGASASTLHGLGGLGDLSLTCRGAQSRNRRFGEAVGRGESIPAARAAAGGVVEGEATAATAHALARKHQVRAFITEHVHRVAAGQLAVSDALEALANWQPTDE